MTERTYSRMTVEDLPFGVEPPVGMAGSAAIEPRCDGIPSRLDEMSPGPVMGAFLASLNVSNLSGYDQIVVLSAHQKMAGSASPFQGGRTRSPATS